MSVKERRGREKRRERETKGDKREYIAVPTAAPKAAAEILFVGNTNLQVEMPLSEVSRICESASSLGHDPPANLDSGGDPLPHERW